MEVWTAAQYLEYRKSGKQPAKGGNKFGAKRAEWGGRTFDSTGEAEYAQHLDLRRKAGEVLDFGGLLGYGPIMPVNQRDPSVFINRGGRLPAPMQSLKN